MFPKMTVDMEERAADEIERTISKNFRGPDGYDMERLVKALLEAQGYTVYQSPKGRDKGVDLLAALGPLGFGTPRICVQVKSGDGKTGRPTLDQLVGTMQNFQAEQGLLVSWGGFTKDIEDAERAPSVQPHSSSRCGSGGNRPSLTNCLATTRSSTATSN